MHLAGVAIEVDAGEGLRPRVRLGDPFEPEERQRYSSSPPAQSALTDSQSISGSSGVG